MNIYICSHDQDRTIKKKKMGHLLSRRCYLVSHVEIPKIEICAWSFASQVYGYGVRSCQWWNLGDPSGVARSSSIPFFIGS